MSTKAEKRGLVPELRFPEFRDAGEWGQAKLGEKDISTFVKERIPLDQVTLESYVSTENLLPDYAGVTTASKIPSTGSFTRYKKGDILISNIRPYLKKVWAATNEGGTSNDVIVIRAKSKVRNSFLSYLLRNDEFINYVMKGAKGIKMPRGDISLMKEYPIAIPANPKEQQKIADCLTSVDELITAQAQKLGALKAHKKGLMQQLFPAEGETVPKLRFPEFRDSGNWKLKPIGKVLIEKPRPIDMHDELEYSLVTVKRRYGGLISRGIFKGESIKVKSQFLVNENDFLISKRQIVHCACGVVPKALDGAIVSNEYSVLIPCTGNDINFFNYFAQQPVVSLSFLQCSIGIVIEKMLFKLKDWLKEEFLFPDYDEQKKIAQFLSNMDCLIENHSLKLETLKSHKKGLMQQLFITTADTQQLAMANMVKWDDSAATTSSNHYKTGFARQLLAAEILHRCHKHPTMGRVKLQKLIHLSEYYAELDDIHGNYHRAAAGPFDNKLMRGVANGLEKQKWFKEVHRENRTFYEPMESSGQHSKYLQRWSEHLPKIHQIINYFANAKTNFCEVVSTLYAAWNDLLIEGREPTDMEIIREASDPNRWHESKAKIEGEKWVLALEWMRMKGLVPRGYGAHTAKRIE